MNFFGGEGGSEKDRVSRFLDLQMLVSLLFAPNNANGRSGWGVRIGVGGIIVGACPRFVLKEGEG